MKKFQPAARLPEVSRRKSRPGSAEAQRKRPPAGFRARRGTSSGRRRQAAGPASGTDGNGHRHRQQAGISGKTAAAAGARPSSGPRIFRPSSARRHPVDVFRLASVFRHPVPASAPAPREPAADLHRVGRPAGIPARLASAPRPRRQRRPSSGTRRGNCADVGPQSTLDPNGAKICFSHSQSRS